MSDPYEGETAEHADARADAAQQRIKANLDEFRPCFVAGTLVETIDGPRPIETLRSGDIVLAADPLSGRLRIAREVLETFRGTSDRLYRISVAGDSVVGTHNHPFYVDGEGWVPARLLHAGSLLITPDGVLTPIDAVERLDIPQEVETFNLRVADVSTYFVRAGVSILVHNNGADWDKVLYWLLGPNARFRPTDVDGVSVWKTTSKQQVENLFRIRYGLEGQSGNHAYLTPEKLAAAGLEAPKTPGDGPLNGVLEHHSIRPAGTSGELSADQIKQAVEGINVAGPDKAKSKNFQC